MVYDFLENSALYTSLGKNIAKGLEALKSMDIEHLELGDYPIDGDKVILKIQCYDTKSPDKARLEAHRSYVDIQYIVSGTEKIGVCPLKNAGAETEAKPENDIWFYDGSGLELPLLAGQFMILYPTDAHAPCITAGSPSHVRKALIKAAIE